MPKAATKDTADALGAGLPLFSWQNTYPNAKLHYVQDVNEANAILSTWAPTVVGFDLEWKPTYVKGERPNPVALVQIGNEEMILLLHIHRMKRIARSRVPLEANIPFRLTRLLADPSVTKLGVGIKEDAIKFYNDFGVDIVNCVDIGHFAIQIDPVWHSHGPKQSLGLARLAVNYLSQTLSKGKVRRSNWEARLTELQQQYAANDAMVSLTIYNILLSKESEMLDPPLPNLYTFAVRAGRAEEEDAAGIVWHPQVSRWYTPPDPVTKDKKKVTDEGHENGYPSSSQVAEMQA